MKKTISDAEKKELLGYILEYMRLHRLNQKEMAVKLGVTPAALTMWIHDDGAGIALRNAENIRFVCREVIAISGNGNIVNSTVVASDEIEQFRAGLIGALVDSEIPGDALKAVLQIVKNFNLPKKDGAK